MLAFGKLISILSKLIDVLGLKVMDGKRQYIVRGGECGERIRAIDWSKTALGPMKLWSNELLSIVNTILNSPLASVLLCNQGGLLIYNDAYARFAGPKHPKILGQNYAEAWPEVADYNHDICGRVNAGETIAYSERFLQLKRGHALEDVYLDLNYSPIFSASGDVTATLVSVVDVTNKVTSRQLAEQALQEARAQRQAAEDISLLNRTITQNASTALFIMDADLHCTFMNPAAVAMVGFSMEELAASGKTLHELIHYKHADGTSYNRLDCPIISAASRLQATSGDETFIRRDGSFFPVYFVASPIIQDGKLASLILEVRDMTETEQLKDSSQAKDDFIAVASHQLRTPATVVKQFVGVLMQEYAGPLNGEQMQCLQQAYDANERQLTIINDLLKTAQVDVKGFKLQMRTASLSKLIRDSAKASQAIFDAKKQQLSLKLPKQAVTAQFDAKELAICIDNLLENASKYSPVGGLISITLKKQTRFIDISVKDNGVGIAPADHQAIFEKFTRINNAMSDTVNGNGLGLYWVKRVIDLHGGSIRIDSALGSGTTITLRLPR